MPKRAGRPSGRGTLNRERVLDAGIAMADAEGIAALSMRRLGKELGVEGMALYNHVRNKDDLLEGMLDRVAGEIELPGPAGTAPPETGSPETGSPGTGLPGTGLPRAGLPRAGSPGAERPEAERPEAGQPEAGQPEAGLPDTHLDWRVRARRRAISAHATLMRHPWSAALWTSSIGVGPARMRYLDSALRDLREAGFAPGPLDRAFHTIENHVVGHAMQELGFALDQDDMVTMGSDLLRSFPVEEYPYLAEHIRHHVEQAGDDAFEFGLDLILDGLERLRVPRETVVPEG